MKVLIALLPLFMVASSFRIARQDADGPLLQAKKLGNAITQAMNSQSNEKFSDYLTPTFLYTYCNYKINRDQLLHLYEGYSSAGNTDFFFQVDTAAFDTSNNLVINANLRGSAMSANVVIIAVPNITLKGQYSITNIVAVVKCNRRRASYDLY